MSLNPFPCVAKTLPITVTASASSSVALPAAGNVLRVVNEGPSVAFISVGAGSQTATLPNSTPTFTSTPILPGEDCCFTIPGDTVYNISAICRAAGTATLDVQVGDGF